MVLRGARIYNTKARAPRSTQPPQPELYRVAHAVGVFCFKGRQAGWQAPLFLYGFRAVSEKREACVYIKATFFAKEQRPMRASIE